ncbi:proto-oncogene Mas-like [Pleurodeles waltl]|uniref:proto-oncogene Mas-like n=1 Tax=Pleurodeles waltl TaxID=8319 RepID=UPI003709AE31
MIHLNSLPSNTTGNTTEWNNSNITLDADDVVLTTFSLLLFFFGLFGNGMVFWYLCFRMKRNKFTVYILNLCVADFMSLIVYSLLLVCMMVDLTQSTIPPAGIIPLEILFIVGYNTDLYLLTAISFERCLSVLHPIWYQCKRPKHQSAIVCGLLWSLSCLVTLLEYFACTEDTLEALGITTSCNLGIFVFMCLLHFSLFIPLMVISNLVLLIQVRRTSLKTHSSKLYIVIAITVFIFLLSAVPPRVISMLKYQEIQDQKLFRYLSVFCSSINSSSNPFIYFFVGSQKRLRCQGSVAEVLQTVFKDSSESLEQGLETVLSTKRQSGYHSNDQ